MLVPTPDGSLNACLILPADAHHNATFATLSFVCHSDGTPMRATIGWGAVLGSPGRPMIIMADDGPMREVRYTRASDNQTVIIADPEAFGEMLLRTQRLMVACPGRGGEPVAASFDTRGLAAAIAVARQGIKDVRGQK